MIQPLHKADAEFLCQSWNKFYPEKYWLDSQTISRNILKCDLTIAEGSFFSESEFVALKRPGTPTWFSGQDDSRCHIAAITSLNPHILNLALAEAFHLGFRTVAFGMDPDHLFPGCPIECEKLDKFLILQNFQSGGEYFDLERSLLDYEVPERCLEALDLANAFVVPLQNSQLDQFKQFLVAEFPGRWKHDALRKVEIDKEPEQVYALWVNDEIEGFAITQDSTSVRPIAGAVWHLNLGPTWGALGPIGISKQVRGKGLGDALLGSSLLGLKARGAHRTIIDWTTLDDFYGQHGFEVTRRYRSFVLDI